jgi:choline dehydrogenase-like flavoprotein
VSAKKNPTGLFDFTNMGSVSVLRASGVGGGSLVYANVTIEPPLSVFDDPRYPIWKEIWIKEKPSRKDYYDTARNAIGIGVIHALNWRDAFGKAELRRDGTRIWLAEAAPYVPNSRVFTLQRISVEPTEQNPNPNLDKPTRLSLDKNVDEATLYSYKLGDKVWVRVDSTGTIAFNVWDFNDFHINPGLSNIAARTMGMDPHWHEDTAMSPTLRRLRPENEPSSDDATNAIWIDRARIFQTEMSALNPKPDTWGSVYSSISDPKAKLEVLAQFSKKPINFCERQGRCILGCLPGARFTLNKQLLKAALSKDPTAATPPLPTLPKDLLNIWALTEVRGLSEDGAGGYRVRVRTADGENKELRAARVIVSAGCVGSIELLLRSRQSLTGLSDRLGFGFSTNGDYLAFLDGVYGEKVLPEKRLKRLNLCKGPVTTSFAHFNEKSYESFHTIEDNGIPRPLARIVQFVPGKKMGRGAVFFRSLWRGTRGWVGPDMVPQPTSEVINQILAELAKEETQVKEVTVEQRLRAMEVKAARSNKTPLHPMPPRAFLSSDEKLGRMMCIAAMGRDEAHGRIWIEQNQLVAQRTDGISFTQDPIYDVIKKTLKRFALQLTNDRDLDFVNPLFEGTPVSTPSVGVSHPLGGNCMAQAPDKGVVDTSGRVFNKNGGFYDGLYVADASVVPSSLGVNPSLTISALALKIADDIIASLPPVERKA